MRAASKKQDRSLSQKLDRVLSDIYIHLFNKPHLQVIVLHKMYKDRNDIKDEHGTTGEGFTQENLDTLICYFKKHKYTFITPKSLDSIDKKKNYILLTFDDGYYNNFYSLEILKKHKVPATFYISTNHIKEQKCFWWDVVFRERRKQGVADEEIGKELNYLVMNKRWEEQEDFVKKSFGQDCLQPLGDYDRPMTIKELTEFASSEFVELGNHTDNHLNLNNNYSKEELIKSINEAQEFLKNILGEYPISIAYPYGCYNERVIQIMSGLGMQSGMTTIDTKTYLADLNENKQLELERVQFTGWVDVEDRCDNVHIDFSLFQSLKLKLKALVGGK
jgi:peptidoglycan/xylan/chitin deacetylase (PgdA/CDA1 family)